MHKFTELVSGRIRLYAQAYLILNTFSPLSVYSMPLQHACYVRTGPKVVKAQPRASHAGLGQDIHLQSYFWTSPKGSHLDLLSEAETAGRYPVPGETLGLS